MLMVCTQPHQYDGRQLSEGEEFEAEDRFVPLILALGRAVVAQQSQTYRTREMTKRKKK